MEAKVLVLLKGFIKELRSNISSYYDWTGVSCTWEQVDRWGLYVGALDRLVEKYEKGERRYSLEELLDLVQKVYSKVYS